MASLAIEGMQWGDEGKGKITDYFASRADIVVRSQGGNNAGHSVVHGEKRYALRLLPSGILHPEVTNVIAEGVVVNPNALLEEIEAIQKAGVTSFKLLLSDRATLLLPYHIALDKARESLLSANKIGTTGRGIGPCYEDRASRNALRVGDLLHPEYLKERLERALLIKNKELSAYGVEPFDAEAIYEDLLRLAEKIGHYITDTGLYLHKALESGKKVLFEGAQGAMLALTSGTYPFVTSSSPLVTAIPENTSLPLDAIDSVLGIFKAYTTRVGSGPFVSELPENSETATAIREKGHEYGVVTKRPRRVGWLDVPLLRYVKRISGVKHAALMLLDVLSAVPEIKIVTAYELDGKILETYPASLSDLARVKPIYKTFPSWKEDLSTCKSLEEFPIEAKNYVNAIEELVGVEINLISVGPEEHQTIVRKELFQ